MTKIKIASNNQKEQQGLEAYNYLAAHMRKRVEDNMCIILLPVPKGMVMVTISKPEVTPGVAAGALALIGDAIRQNGIPKDALVGLGGFVNMRGPEQELLKFEPGSEEKGSKKIGHILDGVSDETLEALLAKDHDTHTIVLQVPKGIVSVNIFGTEVTPAVAVAALVLIGAGIREDGIPEAAMLQLGGMMNVGPTRKSQK